MISNDLTDLIGHMEWADATVWMAVLELPPAEWEDPRVRQLLCHVHAVQWAYLQLWRKETVEVHEPSDFGQLREIRDWGRSYHSELAATLGTLDEPALERTVTFPWAADLQRRYGEVHPTSLRQSILQIASHSTYHRGQINTEIRRLGGEPPLVDFVAWIWAGRPAPDWEAREDA